MKFWQGKNLPRIKGHENFVLPITVISVIALAILLSHFLVAKETIKPVLNQAKTLIDSSGETVLAATSSTTPSVSVTIKSKPTTTLAPKISTKVKIGFAVSNYTDSTGEISSLISKIGHSINTISIYKQFGLATNSTFDPNELAYEKSHNQTILLAWEPWNPSEGMAQTTDYLAKINSGAMDSYINQFADSIKAYASPVDLRFGHEMNGNWYPWGSRPSDYVAAYKHVVDLFRARGVSNVKWIWSINSDNFPYTDIKNVAAFYPGDAYVDRIGIDGFNFGSDSGGFRSFASIFGASYSFVTSTYPKPVYISETSSSETGGDKSVWIKDMFEVLPKSFPKIDEVVWFNILKERDWRVDSTQSSLSAFKSYL